MSGTCAQPIGLLEAKVDSLFEERAEVMGPGYAVAILKNSEVLLQKGYGLANLDYGIPIDSHSVFTIASVSKQFTEACVAPLLMEGTLDLEDPVVHYLPDLGKFRDTVRIKHLLYNTSGLTDYYHLPWRSGKSWSDFNYFSLDECLQTALSQPHLKFRPGERRDYCNGNWMILTRIVEQVSGRSFPDFARERLFDPLGMKNTLVHDDITLIIPNRVQG